MSSTHEYYLHTKYELQAPTLSDRTIDICGFGYFLFSLVLDSSKKEMVGCTGVPPSPRGPGTFTLASASLAHALIDMTKVRKMEGIRPHHSHLRDRARGEKCAQRRRIYRSDSVHTGLI